MVPGNRGIIAMSGGTCLVGGMLLPKSGADLTSAPPFVRFCLTNSMLGGIIERK